MKKKLMLILVAALTLAGCAKTPEGVVVDGITRAVTQTESEIAQMVNDKGLTDKQIAIAATPKRTQAQSVSLKGIGHVIDAQIHTGPLEDIKMFSLWPLPVDYEWIKPILFKEDLPNAIAQPMRDEPAFTEWVIFKEGAAAKTLRWAVIDELSYFDFYDNQFPIMLDDWDEEDRREKVSQAEQQHILDAFYGLIGDLGLAGATILNVQAGSLGCAITFVPQYTQLAVISDSVYLYGSINLTREGPGNISGNFMQGIQWQEDVPRILSFDAILEIAKTHLASDDEATRPATIDHISLRHRYSLDAKNVVTATPVWYFHVAEREAASGQAFDSEPPIENAPVADLKSFSVDAVSGLVQEAGYR